MATIQHVKCDLCGETTEAQPFRVLSAFIGAVQVRLPNPFDVCPTCATRPIADLITALTPKPKAPLRPTHVTPAGKPVTPNA